MSSIHPCSNHALYQLTSDKIDQLIKPLVDLQPYKCCRNFFRFCLLQPNIEGALDKAIRCHKGSLLSEEAGLHNLSLMLSIQAIQTLKMARFKEGSHPELDKIFQHSQILITSQPSSIPTRQNMEKELAAVELKEAEYNEAILTRSDPLKIDDTLQQWTIKLAAAYRNCKKECERLETIRFMPPSFAFIYARIFLSHGLMHYASSQANHPVESSLRSLKMAFLLLQYNLGLSAFCPDLAPIKELDDLQSYSWNMRQLNKELDNALKDMNPQEWAEKIAKLPQEQLLNCISLLTYLNLSMGLMQPSDDTIPEKLLSTALKTFEQALKNSSYDQKEIKNQMAEFQFNDYSGYLAAKADQLEKKGEPNKAEEMRQELLELWRTCIDQAKDPDLMWARILNKHTLLVELTPEEKVTLLKLSIEVYIAMPEEKQNPLLIALAWNNLSHAQKELSDEAAAKHSAQQAHQLATKCLATGYPTFLLEDVLEWSKSLLGGDLGGVAS